MLGKACERFEAGNAIKSRTTSQVLRRWQMVPSLLEARVMRLGWYQRIARDVNNNVQLLCAVFGMSSIELRRSFSPDSNLTEDRRLGFDPNPWARQFFGDIEASALLELGRDLVS